MNSTVTALTGMAFFLTLTSNTIHSADLSPTTTTPRNAPSYAQPLTPTPSRGSAFLPLYSDQLVFPNPVTATGTTTLLDFTQGPDPVASPTITKSSSPALTTVASVAVASAAATALPTAATAQPLPSTPSVVVPSKRTPLREPKPAALAALGRVALPAALVVAVAGGTYIILRTYLKKKFQ